MAEPFQFDGQLDAADPGVRPVSDQERVKDIGALLRGETGEDAGDGETLKAESGDVLEGEAIEYGDGDESLPEGGDTKTPEWLAELAEIANVEADQIYNIRVPMGDGRDALTIGELKDSVGRVAELDGERQAFDDERANFGNEMIRARQEFTELMALLPQEAVTPEMVDAAQQQYANHIETERQAREQIMPQWADQEVWSAAQNQIATLMETYGFTRADVEVGTTDHRLLKALWDFSELKNRVARADAAAKKLTNTARRNNKRRTADTGRRQQAQQLDKARAGTTGDKVAGVRAILQEANK